MRRRIVLTVAAGSAALMVAGGAVEASGRTSPPLCATGQLEISLVEVPGGADHVGAVIRFRNRGGACVLRGYPGLDGVTPTGHVVDRARRTPFGYLGGGRTTRSVVVRHGATASALLEGLDGPSHSVTCPGYSDLLVTPPNAHRSVRLADRGPCRLEVHPVVGGPGGGANVAGG